MSGMILSGIFSLNRALQRSSDFALDYVIQIAVCLGIAIILCLLTVLRQHVLSRQSTERLEQVRQVLLESGLFATILNEMEGAGNEKAKQASGTFQNLIQWSGKPARNAKGIVISLKHKGMKLLRKKFQIQRFDAITSPILEAELRLALARVLIEELGEIRPQER